METLVRSILLLRLEEILLQTLMYKLQVPSGIAGCWIALTELILTTPSGINGWLECTTQYNGVGLT